MSIKLFMELEKLKEKRKDDLQRLDNLEKAVNTLKKSVSFMERNPAGDIGVRVPQTPLPDTLEKLEIGKQPKGT